MFSAQQVEQILVMSEGNDDDDDEDEDEFGGLGGRGWQRRWQRWRKVLPSALFFAGAMYAVVAATRKSKVYQC